MSLLTAGYWHSTYWAENYWHDNYWIDYGAVWTSPSSIHSKCGESGSYLATNTIDENVSTMWNHSDSCYHWIVFDLGQTYNVTKIRIYQSGSSTTNWGRDAGLKVYVGDDPSDLGSLLWEGILSDGGWNESGAFNKNGRYIKLVSKHHFGTQRMYEFEAYCATAGGGSIPVITHHYRNMRAN